MIVDLSRPVSQLVCGVNPAMRALERAVADLAPTDIPILLSGESGTGKEIFALEIHRRSRHSDEPFVRCTSAALTPESLPIQVRTNVSDRGEGSAVPQAGTVFFDEISRLDFPTQDRLLQLLLEGENPQSGQRVGARIISSTSHNLEDEMRAGRFRRELYYRISSICLSLPPLRERKEDIPSLLTVLLNKYEMLFSRPALKLDAPAMDLIFRHPWSGNVRELENFARTSVLLGDAKIALRNLAGEIAESTSGLKPQARASQSQVLSLKEAAREASRKAEHELILRALERTHWNRKRAAVELHISYKALLYKLKTMNLHNVNESS